MTYIPTPATTNDVPAQSQAIIYNNFLALQDAINQNHVNLNTGTGQDGKHKFLQMPNQSTAPTTSASEGGLYCKASSSSGSSRTELFFRRESNGAEIEISGALAATNGWQQLPSGLILKWGTSSLAGTTETEFAFGGPAYATAVYYVSVVPLFDATHSTFQPLAYKSTTAAANPLTHFVVRVGGVGTYTGFAINFSWMAIGI